MTSLRDRWNFALGAAVGAGVMALFDPGRGAKRRAWLRDKAIHTGKIAAREGRKQLKNAANHAYGTVAEYRSKVRERSATVDDQQLQDRVRAQLGHVSSHGSLNIKAREGNVVVSGVVHPGERQKIEERLREIRGVRGYQLNLMDVKDKELRDIEGIRQIPMQGKAF